MTDKIDDGGPAFPIPASDLPGSYAADPGMSLRDWFAGQAFGVSFGTSGGFVDVPPSVRAEAFKLAAEMIYEAADAMLAARKGGGA